MEITKKMEENSEVKKQEIERFEDVKEVVQEKKYKLKKFTSKHIFLMFKLLSNIGFKDFKKAFESDEIKGKIKKASKNERAELFQIVGIEAAMGILDIILSNLDKCEKDLYKLLAAVSNLNEDEIMELSGADFASMIIDFVQKEDFMDFFKVVSRLFK